MGIDVWFERPLASEMRADRQKAPENISLSTPAANARRAPVMNEARSPSMARPVAVPTVSTNPDPTNPELRPDATARRGEGSNPVEPFVLACVRGNGVVLLTRGPLLKNQQRMARDIVLAAMRVRRVSAVDLQIVDYRYPPAADLGAGRVGAPDRALRAFLSVQRQGVADDSGGRASESGGLILITDNAHSLFQGWLTEPQLVISDLATLAGDAAQKRALWLRLRATV